jgi:phage protein D
MDESNEKPKYYKKSMAKAMKTYRANFSEEKRLAINEYQKKKMAERRLKIKEEKKAQGIEIKIGRPKLQKGLTKKEMEEKIEVLINRIKELGGDIP